MSNVEAIIKSEIVIESELKRFWNAFNNYRGDINAPLTWWKEHEHISKMARLFRHWDAVLFPNAEHSYDQAASANRRAVHAEVDAMDAASKAAAPPSDGSRVPNTIQAQALTSTAQQDEPEPVQPPASTQQDEAESHQDARTSPPAARGHGRRRTRSRRR
ncbi:hypothetical protein C8R45DRAFT_928944 [Mycena sanguinolenta]|nr:hypothetical protein C8R45DRAFT_928944 [Mycena sanguinolenta]